MCKSYIILDVSRITCFSSLPHWRLAITAACGASMRWDCSLPHRQQEVNEDGTSQLSARLQHGGGSMSLVADVDVFSFPLSIIFARCRFCMFFPSIVLPCYMLQNVRISPHSSFCSSVTITRIFNCTWLFAKKIPSEVLWIEEPRTLALNNIALSQWINVFVLYTSGLFSFWKSSSTTYSQVISSLVTIVSVFNLNWFDGHR